MRCDYYGILVPDLAIVLLVLELGVREVDALVEVREVVLASPCGDFLWLPSRAPVAIGSPAIRFLQELLVFAFQFVVEDDAPHRCATLVEALLRPQIRSVDLGVVRELPRLP
jgi:hypothetical protein